MDHKDIKAELWEKLVFMREWIKLELIRLIGKAEEIAATKLVYNELSEGGYSAGFPEYLLCFKRLLKVVRDKWIEGNGSEIVHDGEMTHVLWSIADKRDAEKGYELDSASFSPEQEVQTC